MFRRFALPVLFGMLVWSAASCAEAPKEEEAPPEVAKPAEPEGPFYELTKESVLNHADWTSANIMFKGAKLGDKAIAVASKFGKSIGVDPVGDHYRTIYDNSSYAIYSHKMTGELQKIEVYSPYAGQISDPKFSKALSSGSESDMRAALGMEEASEINPNTTAMEYVYDSKGVRFAKYNFPNGVKMNSIIFSKMRK
jgi:hypothetical protein